MDIYLWKDGGERGPYTLDELREAVASGEIDRRQTARLDSATEWQPLDSLVSIDEAEQTVPSAAPTPLPTVAPAEESVVEPNDPPESLLPGCFRTCSILPFLGAFVSGAAYLLGGLEGKFRTESLVTFGLCSLTGMMMLAVGLALDYLRKIALRLRRIEMKK
jgi:hypothetical protein